MNVKLRLTLVISLTACMTIAIGNLVAEASPVSSSLNGRLGGGQKQELEPLRRGSLSEDLCRDARDGKLDSYPLLEASLIAGGVTHDADLRRYRQMYDQLKVKVFAHCRADESGLNGPANSHHQASRLLASMHSVFLTGEYDEHLHRMDECLATGNYNCLTSTILLVCLAAEIDQPIVGVARTGHVFAQYQSDPPLRMESTDPQGCQNPDEPVLMASGEQHRTISACELVAKVYYNRAVEMLQYRQFESALEMLAAAEVLDPHDALTRQNRLAAYNNWALESCQNYRFEEAIQLVQQGLAISPNYPLLKQNDAYIHRTWAENLSRQGRFSDAVAVTRQFQQRRGTGELRPLQQQLTQQWVAELRRSGQHVQADQVASRFTEPRRNMPLVSHPSN